jgi:hypothetical protein
LTYANINLLSFAVKSIFFGCLKSSLLFFHYVKDSSYALVTVKLIQYLHFQEAGPICVITNAKPILDELEGHQMALQAMQDGGSGVIGSFIDDIIQWKSTLQHIEVIVKLWLEVQNQWLELEEVCFSTVLAVCDVSLSTECGSGLKTAGLST